MITTGLRYEVRLDGNRHSETYNIFSLSNLVRDARRGNPDAEITVVLCGMHKNLIQPIVLETIKMTPAL